MTYHGMREDKLATVAALSLAAGWVECDAEMLESTISTSSMMDNVYFQMTRIKASDLSATTYQDIKERI